MGSRRVRGAAPRRLPAGFHWWNRLARIDIDLTLEQFGADERVQEPRVLSRLAGPLRRGEAEYLLLRSRVLARLAGN